MAAGERGVLWKMVRAPLAVAVVATIAVAALTEALDHPLALALFAFAFFALAALVAEFYRGAAAQRALSGGGFLGALGHVVARNRRRCGYIVHAGFALLLIAVAASSSFQTSEDVRLMPGRAAGGRLTVTCVRPTQSIDPQEQKLVFGAVLNITRDGEQVTTLLPARDYYSSNAGDATIAGFFEGEATSECGRRTTAAGTSGPPCART